MRVIVLLLSLFFMVAAEARIAAYEFADKGQETTYKELIHELRCLVCQNQNIADSNAELAQDLKRKTYELVSSGKNKDEIRNYMTERYGDFVLYRPPVSNATLLLWIGPFIIFLVGLFFLVRVIRARRNEQPAELTEEQKQQASELLKGK
jgi:cytochrome c-type biogenesis protein CcmH